MDNKVCAACGTQLNPNAVFCPNCGARWEEPKVQEPHFEPAMSEQVHKVNAMPQMPAQSKVDVKATVLSNIIPVACLVIGLILVIAGLSVSIPGTFISSYSMTEYVGGDAYNFIIEAALRGGKIAGATVTKCVYIAVGLLISCMSALKINVVKAQ